MASRELFLVAGFSMFQIIDKRDFTRIEKETFEEVKAYFKPEERHNIEVWEKITDIEDLIQYLQEHEFGVGMEVPYEFIEKDTTNTNATFYEDGKFNQSKYKQAFDKENYDRSSLLMPKGKKEIIKEYAKAAGISLNSYINKAVDEKIERDIKEKSEGNRDDIIKS